MAQVRSKAQDATRQVRAPAHARVAVAVRKGVQWISLVDSAGHGFDPPELPEPVSRAVDALLASTASQSGAWSVASHREAANFLVTGPEADALAAQLARRGACEKIVRCASRDDMLRVARVLALCGDYVVQGDQVLVIFPPWF